VVAEGGEFLFGTAKAMFQLEGNKVDLGCAPSNESLRSDIAWFASLWLHRRLGLIL
jgi:hypothetical protein